MSKGMIMNIQKYSIHDGPGIRTTVFFKGCPLNCWWCHNPESQNNMPEVLFYKERCSHCNKCLELCENGCVKSEGDKIVTNSRNCTRCEKCLDYCINNARELKGREIGVAELSREIEKDIIFYEESGGGATFSGGEPLSQIDFLEEILKICKAKGIHTTVDTSGFAKWESIERIQPYVDLFLYDIKHMNSDEHKKYTGVGNELILENLQKLNKLTSSIYVRVPIIPSVNDDKENLLKLKEFIGTLNVKQVNLLPYHHIGMDKYDRLNMVYKMQNAKEPDENHMNDIKSLLQHLNIDIKIGG